MVNVSAIARRLRVLVLLVLAALVLARPAHTAESKLPAPKTGTEAAKIRIAAEGWGSTDLADLQVVLDAVAAEFGTHFPNRRLGAVDVVAAGANPIVRFDKGPAGEYVIELSARDGRWHQFVYQFAHELCHIYSNFDNKVSTNGKVASRNQWFEESSCEAAAMFTLRKLAVTWEAAPPAEKWSGYAPLFARYAERLLSEPHRHLPPGHSLAGWYREHRQELQTDPYRRNENEVVANRLLALFEENPDDWGAIAYLNADKLDAAKEFADFLEAWCQACPQRYRRIVEQIIALFGPRTSTTTIASE